MKDKEMIEILEGAIIHGQEKQEALENLLKRYKELEEENKELLEVRVSASAHTRIIELEEENKNQKEALNQANKKILAQKGQLKVFNQKEFIPISVIQNTLEEYKNMEINYKNQIEDTTILAKALELPEDAPLDEIYVEIKRIKNILEEREKYDSKF